MGDTSKLVLILVGGLVAFLFGKKIYAKIKLTAGLNDYTGTGTAAAPDYKLISTELHSCFDVWYSWLHIDTEKVISLINALSNISQWQELCYKYASDYTEDLHLIIQDKLSDSTISKLKYK